jgi:hypothetical protein
MAPRKKQSKIPFGRPPPAAPAIIVQSNAASELVEISSAQLHGVDVDRLILQASCSRNITGSLEVAARASTTKRLPKP